MERMPGRMGLTAILSEIPPPAVAVAVGFFAASHFFSQGFLQVLAHVFVHDDSHLGFAASQPFLIIPHVCWHWFSLVHGSGHLTISEHGLAHWVAQGFAHLDSHDD